MSAAPMNEPDPDYARCEQVKNAAEKVMQLDPPDISWMGAGFAGEMLAVFYSAYTLTMMELIKRGITPAEAQQSAQQQAPLLAFQLGLQVGAEIESTRAMRELFGE